MKKRLTFLLIFTLLLFGCKDRFYTVEDFPSVLKIDSHMHINSPDGAFEDQAARDNFILITINVDVSDSAGMKEQFDYAINIAQKHPGKIFYVASFYFDTAGWGTEVWNKKVINQLEKHIAPGAIAVKLWKNIGMTVCDRNGKFIMVDDPLLQPVFNFIKGKGLPVTGHLGEPRNCWLPIDEMTVKGDKDYFAGHPQYHMFLHPEYPSYEDQIKARDNMVRDNPDLTFVGCHLGSLEWNVDSLAARLDKYPNMAVDMSARICHLQYQSAKDIYHVRDFIIKYQDRLLYGTDAVYNSSTDPEGFRKRIHETWINDWKYLATDADLTSDDFNGKFAGLKLPIEVVNKIYSGNAIKWYKLPLNN